MPSHETNPSVLFFLLQRLSLNVELNANEQKSLFEIIDFFWKVQCLNWAKVINVFFKGIYKVIPSWLFAILMKKKGDSNIIPRILLAKLYTV